MVLVNASAADTVDSGTWGSNITWTLDSAGTLTLSGTGGTPFDYITPWDDYKSSITRGVIEEGIGGVNGAVFTGCSSMTSVSIGDSVTQITNGAFANCSSLKELKLPYGLKNIGENAFGGCSSLVSLDIPDTVTSIGNWAFANCSKLSSLELSSSLTSIGIQAFSGCKALNEVAIPPEVSYMGQSAFGSCPDLSVVYWPLSLTSVDQPFHSCENLTVYYEGSADDWSAIKLGYLVQKVPENTTVHYNAEMPDFSTSSGDKDTPTTQILTPVLDEITNPEEGLTISWLRPLNTEDVEYVADGYYVYRKTAGGSYSKIATLSGIDNTSYTDTNVTHGTVYTYTVAAYYNGQTGSRDETGLTGTYIGPLADVTVTDAAKLAVWFDEDVDVMYETFSGTVKGHFTLWMDTQVKELTTPASYQPGPVTLDIKLTGGYSFAPNSKVQTKTITAQTLSATTANPNPKVRESLEIYILNGQTGTIQVTASAPTCVSASTQAIRPVMRFMDFEEDTWSLINVAGAFCYDDYYEIPLKRYQQVYGDQIGTLMYEAEHKPWGGNCGGMAWTAALIATRGLDLPGGYSGLVNHQASGISLGKTYWKSGSALTKMVEQYQLFQSELKWQDPFCVELVEQLPETYYQYDESSGIYSHRTNGTYIQTVCDAIRNSTGPLEATVTWDGNAHAVILMSNELRDEGGGWYSTPIYDCNHPYLDDAYYSVSLKEAAYSEEAQRLWLNPSKNLFRAYMGANSKGEDQVRGSENNVAITHGTTWPDLLTLSNVMAVDQTEIDPDAWFPLYQNRHTQLIYTADTSFTLVYASDPDKVIAVVENGQVTQLESGVINLPDTGGGTLYLSNSNTYRIKNASGRYSFQTADHIIILESTTHGLTYDSSANTVQLTPSVNGTATVTISNLNDVDDVQAVQVSGTVQSGKVISYALDGDHRLTVDGDENLSNPKVSILEDEFTQVPDVDLSRPLDVEDSTAVVYFTGCMVVLDADADVEIAEEDLDSYVMTIEGGTVVRQATWLTDITVEVKDGKQYINILDGWYTLHITGSSATDIVVMDSDESGKVSRTVTFDDVRLSNEDVKLSVNCDAVGQKYTLVQGRKTIQPTSDTADLKLAFVDVKSRDYFYDPVRWAVANGITSGTSSTTFSPHQACTRAQAVTFLWRAAGSPEPERTKMPFTDVARGSYYYKAVLWAVEQGITTGTSANTFSPNTKCTRAQIVTLLWRADDTSPEWTGSTGFSDVSVSAYYWFPVRWAVKEGITRGTSATTFSPNADCTRAQIVTFLYRALAT